MDAPAANKMPSTVHHVQRAIIAVPAAPIAGALVALAMLAHSLPGARGRLPALRAPLGIEDHTADGAAARSHSTTARTRSARRRCSTCSSARDVAATFFLVGEQVRRSPALAREVAQRGHDVALHCDRHRNLLRLTAPQVSEDLARALDAICGATDRPIASTARLTGLRAPLRC